MVQPEIYDVIIIGGGPGMLGYLTSRVVPELCSQSCAGGGRVIGRVVSHHQDINAWLNDTVTFIGWTTAELKGRLLQGRGRANSQLRQAYLDAAAQFRCPFSFAVVFQSLEHITVVSSIFKTTFLTRELRNGSICDS